MLIIFILAVALAYCATKNKQEASKKKAGYDDSLDPSDPVSLYYVDVQISVQD